MSRLHMYDLPFSLRRKKQAQQKLSFFPGNNTHESRYSDISCFPWNVASRAACKNLAKWMTVRHHPKPSLHWTSGSHSLASQKWAARSEDRIHMGCPCFIRYVRNSSAFWGMAEDNGWLLIFPQFSWPGFVNCLWSPAHSMGMPGTWTECWE